jgi:enterochelin esterase-like enzyme
MKKFVNSLLPGVLLFVLLSAGSLIPAVAFKGYPFKTFSEFRIEINRIAGLKDAAQRDAQLTSLWNELKADNQIPFKIDDSVAFLYRGEAKEVSWAGDFNNWKPGQSGFAGKRMGQSDLWMAVQSFPEKARLDYKIVVDGNWVLDPANPYQQMGGMGPNSELHMPGWHFPDDTELGQGVIRGMLSDEMTIKSDILGYTVGYKVYTPYNYMQVEGLPTIYVTDGEEYADDEKGALVTILDNLIFNGDIKPLIAIFVDPRDPANEKDNRRNKELTCNQAYADFFDKELIPAITDSYKTHDCPDDRAIIGMSLGGMNALWLGAVKVDRFHYLGIQSPAFNQKVIDTFAGLDWFPYRVYLTTGTFFDTQKQALELKPLLEKNQVDFQYVEVPEGHSWGAWRAELGDMLRWFFPAGM